MVDGVNKLDLRERKRKKLHFLRHRCFELSSRSFHIHHICLQKKCFDEDEGQNL